MTPTRSMAYGRVMHVLSEIGPAKLLPSEQTAIRGAADALLFSGDFSRDAADAMAEVAALVDRLIDSERWSAARANELLGDIWACGPALTLSAAA